MDNDSKQKTCNGYESVFTFLNDEDFSNHLLVCESCRLEHERMKKVSELICEAKPYIKEKQKRKNILKAACAAFVVFFTGSCFQLFIGTGLYTEVVALNQPTVEEMGLPVDEYGFLMVD